MSSTETLPTALAAFDDARRSFLEALAAAPDASLRYLRPGDDYAIGGLVFHVNVILEHYLGVLDNLVTGGFRETEASDRPGLFEEGNARARSGMTPAERSAALAATERLHGAVRSRLAALAPGDFGRRAPVRYAPGGDPLPTSPADVVGWLTDHYREHVPQVGDLVADWRRNGATLAAIDAFNDAFGRGDVAAIMACMTDDCVFENTFPAPDGERHVGADAVRGFWERFFAATAAPRFETEELVVAGDRAVARWVFHWSGDDPGHVRGVDVLRVRDGKVAEKLSYVKG